MRADGVGATLGSGGEKRYSWASGVKAYQDKVKGVKVGQASHPPFGSLSQAKRSKVAAEKRQTIPTGAEGVNTKKTGCCRCSKSIVTTEGKKKGRGFTNFFSSINAAQGF